MCETDLKLNPPIRRFYSMIIRGIRRIIRLFLQLDSTTDYEIKRLKDFPRYQKGDSGLLGPDLKFVDSASFLFLHDELFRKQIYQFNTSNPSPYIIDAGANIGLSLYYFKQRFPSARIVAFEPDPEVFEVLEENVNSLDLTDIELVRKGLWNQATTLQFFAEGADGGRIAVAGDHEQLQTIETVRLRSYLDRRVDLLKMDIEGAETDVLEDCADLLHHVDRIFVEYHSFVRQPQKLHHLLAVLAEAGFRYHIQHVGVTSKHPLMKIQSYLGMDSQLNIFGVREGENRSST